MSGESAQLISEILLEANPPLSLFHFYNNMSGNGGGFAISRIITHFYATLQDIRFSATRCMQEGCKAVIEVMLLCDATLYWYIFLCEMKVYLYKLCAYVLLYVIVYIYM